MSRIPAGVLIALEREILHFLAWGKINARMSGEQFVKGCRSGLLSTEAEEVGQSFPVPGQPPGQHLPKGPQWLFDHSFPNSTQR